MDVKELVAPTAAVKNYLEQLLREVRFDPGFLKKAATYLGWRNVQIAIGRSQPQTITGRRGEFGEVLSAAILSQFHGYIIPVSKLRFAITGGQSLPRTDIVALKLDGRAEIGEVCFIESKLRTTADCSAAVDAYEQLKRDGEKEVPEILLFVCQRLYERGDALLEKFMRYLHERADVSNKDTFRIALIWETAEWSEAVLQNLQDNEVELNNLTTHAVKIEGLSSLTDELFSRLGIEVLSDDD